jgi:hypothetical protein
MTPLSTQPSHPRPHPVHLSGLRLDERAALPPLINERRDQEFVDGLMLDLSDPARHASLTASKPARQDDGALRLFQPLQRVFNLLVLEAFCEQPGQPRLDPRKIESSGFVLRRIQGERKLAWLKLGTRVFGWEAVDEALDPAQERRGWAVQLGHAALNARAPSQQRLRSAGSTRLANQATAVEGVSEDVQPLFIAPPEVCQGAGKTVLFGTLRVASGELSEAPSTPVRYGSDPAERAQLRADMLPFLQPHAGLALPLAGRSFTSEDAMKAARGAAAAISKSEFDSLAGLIALLQQLHCEFDAFANSGPALVMQTALRAMGVETEVPASYPQPARTERRDAYAFLLEAKAVLLDAVRGARLTLPNRWAAVALAQSDAVFEASLACLQQQFVKLMPSSGRFDMPGNGLAPQFVVRAFVRLKPEHPGCAARLVWSAYSEPFRIAPWYESSGAPVPVIAMPDLFDRAALARIKPSVAFALPPKLAQLLRSKADGLIEGKGDAGDGLGLGWICSFSLPIITLCAFIVLNIFLMLLNLIFFWLPFLKICIPVPKAKE